MTLDGSRNNSGFTLIELVVGLAILSMVALLSAEALRMGSRAWSSSQALLDDTDEVSAAQAVLRRTLSNALPAGPHAQSDQVFAGTRDDLRFVAPAPGALGTGVWSHYRIGVASNGSERQLSARWDRPGISRTSVASATTTDEALLKDISALTFSYWSAQSGWLSEWSQGGKTPELVRIQVAFGPADRRHWPDLTVRPRIMAPPNCRFDLVQLQCR